jgi:hypothetical protein
MRLQELFSRLPNREAVATLPGVKASRYTYFVKPLYVVSMPVVHICHSLHFEDVRFLLPDLTG